MYRSELERALNSKDFCITAELVPPLTTNGDLLLEKIAPLQGLVDAVNVTDMAGAKTTMSSFAAAAILARHGIEPVLQVTCRDRNRIALAADLIGAATQGIHNILPLFGDDPTHGDQPEATSVHDLNTMELIALAQQMSEEGTLPSGREIEPAPVFFIGAGDIPQPHPADGAPPKLIAKVDAGTQFVQTQLCYDTDLIKQYIDGLHQWGVLDKVKILISLAAFATIKSARWMKENLWGVAIPDNVMKRMELARDQNSEGRKICIELIQSLHDIQGIAGVHLMSPGQPINNLATLIKEGGGR